MQLAQATRRYLVQIEADGRAPSTIAQYRRHLALLDGWLATARRPQDVRKLSHEDLAAFLTSPAATRRPDGIPKKATAMNVLRSSLRAFFGYVHAAGMAPRNPAALVRRARCSPPPPRTLSDDEVHRLLAVADARPGRAARRDRMLVRLMLGTGLRLGSALGLRVQDVDLERGELRVLRTKGDAPLTLPVSRQVARELRAYLGGATAGPVFPGAAGRVLTGRQAGRRIAELARAAGLAAKASAHVLRHVFACRLLKDTGGNLPIVQQALAHRSIASTTVYARLEGSALRAALRA